MGGAGSQVRREPIPDTAPGTMMIAIQALVNHMHDTDQEQLQLFRMWMIQTFDSLGRR